MHYHQSILHKLESDTFCLLMLFTCLHALCKTSQGLHGLCKTKCKTSRDEHRSWGVVKKFDFKMLTKYCMVLVFNYLHVLLYIFFTVSDKAGFWGEVQGGVHLS